MDQQARRGGRRREAAPPAAAGAGAAVAELEERAGRLALDVIDGRDGAAEELARAEEAIREAERRQHREARTARALTARERAEAEAQRLAELERLRAELDRAGDTFINCACRVERELGARQQDLFTAYAAVTAAAAHLGVTAPELRHRVAPRLAHLAGRGDLLQRDLSRMPLDRLAASLVESVARRAAGRAT